MNLTEDSLIEYHVVDKNGEEVYLTFSLQAIEGSVPNFYDQLKEALRTLGKEFDIESSKIVGRILQVGEDLCEDNEEMQVEDSEYEPVETIDGEEQIEILDEEPIEVLEVEEEEV